MKSPLFRWLPEARFYGDALEAIAKLESRTLIVRDEDADGSREEVASINNITRGFEALTKTMRSEGLLNQEIDGITLTKWHRQGWDAEYNEPSEDVRWILRLQKNGKTLKELRIASNKVLEDAVWKQTHRQIATLTIVISVILFIIGIVLLLIGSQQLNGEWLLKGIT